ncbi:DEAD/DEAH box helicase [Coprothermobacter platensis]|uniref:DEAD/DEAH box helicase n=1 Tax=Coprothermobacter platensis TaxID=108819 RepID=UPI00036CD4B6|nr:DEAD/DEAH box helicase [Coprothermobacter platensis]
MRITSQDPLLYFVVEAKNAFKSNSILLPESDKEAFIDYYAVLFGNVPAHVYSAKDLTQEQLQPEGEPLVLKKNVPMQDVLDFLQRAGYKKVDFCEEPFQWAKRGFVIDVFSNELLRLDFDENDLVESIRIVDPESQMSLRRVEEETLWTKQRKIRVADTITQLLVYDRDRSLRELSAVDIKLNVPMSFVAPQRIEKFTTVPNFSTEDLMNFQGKMVLVTQFPEVFQRRMQWPIEDCIVNGINMGASQFLVQGAIRMPFTIEEYDVHIDRESLGWKVGRRRSLQLSWQGLKVGEPVLHLDRGTGIYQGIEYLDNKPYFSILFKDGRVLVPFERSQKLVRVPSSMSVDSLSPEKWGRKKGVLNERALKMKTFLEARFKQRRNITSPPITPDEEVMKAFENSFEYEETSDQKQAIKELSDWLSLATPEEALIIGESGVGKTEVLLRTAVAVASSGHKAALIVPTRVLVDQYMAAYAERVSKCGLILSDNPKDQWDILIGTHSILKSNLYDESIALAVFDEEQKFGVTHKNWFQEHFPWIKVIFSSATPIPRTFFLARRGYVKLIRMHELPYGRQKVSVYADEYSSSLVKKLLAEELERGGLSVYIHPTIEGIDMRALEIQQWFLDAEVEVLHAEMNDKRIKSVFKRLQDGQIDILVATTIMEAGVDLPIANTIIVEDSSHLGVSQMYQLKGRVGRNSVKSYAWFLYPPTASVSTRNRINSTVKLLNYSDTYALAELDARYRGIGEIFGLKQHGLVKQEEVFAVDALLEQSYREEETEINSYPLSMNVPEWVLPEPERSNLIKEILDADTERELMQVFLMLRDLAGELPEETKSLFAYSELKVLGNKRGVTMIKFNPGNVLIETGDEVHRLNVRSVSPWEQIMSAIRFLGGAEEWFEILKV